MAGVSLALPTSSQNPAALGRQAHRQSDFNLAAMTRGMVAAENDAFAQFQAAYFERLARYLIVVTAGDELRMRDALQETFRRVAKHVRVFDSEEVFWSWLTTLARSAVIDEHRTAKRYWAVLERFRKETPPEANLAYAADERLNELLAENLAELDPADRALVEAKYLDRTPVKEIAARLGTTEGAVESRLVRLRQRLKAALMADLKHETDQ